MFIKYISQAKDNEIILPGELIGQNNLIYKKILLHIGCWQRELSVKYMETLPADVIGLSRILSKNFMLPETLDYKVRFENRNIYLGPVIGMLFVTNHKTLTPEFLSAYKCYLLHYNEVKGLAFIGSFEGINADNQTMKGYFYQPDSDPCFVYGVFPYPDALYRRVNIYGKKFDSLTMSMGERIFNTYFFNKWEMWECLSPYNEINQHLPYTVKLTDINDLVKMLNQYDSVYLKKIFGQKSMGIYKVIKLENGYQFIDRLKRQYIFTSTQEVSEFLKEMTKKNGGYIIQQAINAKSFENRSFDMRVILQKDENKDWTLSGMIARFGGIGNISSNIGLKGIAMGGIEALKKVFNMTEEEAVGKEKEIAGVCSEACDILNKSIGHYADLGIDVVIDENQKIWILEINKLHYHLYPVYALKDRQMYYDIASKPLKYAGALAGF